VRTVSQGIEEYHKRSDGSLLIITHSTKILESLKVDYTHVLVKGRVVTTGGAGLVDKINEYGFEKFEQMLAERLAVPAKIPGKDENPSADGQ